jgi:hypothetical protein
MTERDPGKRRRWTEYWVSERDEHGDVIDYFWQVDAKDTRMVHFAWKGFEQNREWHPNAVVREIEKVRCTAVIDEAGNVYDLDRTYETVAERKRP